MINKDKTKIKLITLSVLMLSFLLTNVEVYSQTEEHTVPVLLSSAKGNTLGINDISDEKPVINLFNSWDLSVFDKTTDLIDNEESIPYKFLLS